MKYWWKSGLCAAVVLSSSLAHAAHSDRPVDLSRLPRTSEYRAISTHGFWIPAANVPNACAGPAVLTDIDQDGYDDFVSAYHGLVHGYRYVQGQQADLFQFNPPPEFAELSQSLMLLPADCDGDGLDEIVVRGNKLRNQQFGFFVYDPRSHALESHFLLGPTSDQRADGYWGAYTACGTIAVPTADSTTEQALLLVCSSGLDIDGRGVLAIRPADGQVLWRFSSGAAIAARLVRIVDLDGDGENEIVAGAECPSNLSRPINGYLDDVLRVFVFDTAGDILWDRTLSGFAGWISLECADLDRDGTTEIITSTAKSPEIQSRLAVWSAHGDLLADVEEDGRLFGRLAVDPECEEGQILVKSGGDECRLYRFQEGRLRRTATAGGLPEMYVDGFFDVLPEHEGDEIVVSNPSGLLLILDHHLEVLAHTQEPQGPAKLLFPGSRVWQADKETRILLRTTRQDKTGLSFSFVRNPWLARNRIGVASASASLCLMGILGIAVWARGRSRSRPHLGPVPRGSAASRRYRLQLLDRLEVANHGSLGTLKPLRRYLWHLEGLVHESGGESPDFTDRVRHFRPEMREAIDTLQESIELARALDLRPESVDQAADALSGIVRVEECLSGSPTSPASFNASHSTFRASLDRIEAALLGIRQSLEATFCARFEEVLARVLGMLGDRIVELGILVSTTGCSHTQPTACRIDPEELVFVVDNLVSNALRAMETCAERKLHIAMRTEHGMLHCTFKDSGHGIPPEYQEDALSTRYTTRPDLSGGLGLPKSAEILHRYDGKLSILDSRPGGGTTFELVIPLSQGSGPDHLPWPSDERSPR